MSNVVPPIDVDPDGTITVPSFRLPLSAALSSQTATQMARSLAGGTSVMMMPFDEIESAEDFKAAVDSFRARVDETVAIPLSEKLAAQFPVERRSGEIGGVPVEEFIPLGAQTAGQLLINLHGGGFFSGAVHVGRVESIPMCNLGNFRIVSVDYRQGYEHFYPAASEDVLAVYADLLKSYPPERIGIYGGSAGGVLTLQATAWILDKGLPPPGAIGVFGAGADGSGDGSSFWAAGNALHPPADLWSSMLNSRFGYLADARRDDPLVNPNCADEAFRVKFPPCLLITGTRSFDLSPAIATHRALSRAGVEADLHVFDGLGHCFYYQAGSPEGSDAYQTMVRFFRKHLDGDVR